MNKKGQFQVFLPFLLIGLVVAFIFAIVAIPTAKVFDDAVDALSEDDAFGSSNESVESMQVAKGLATTAFDQLVFIVLFAVILGTIIIALFTDFNPVILGIMILAIILLVIVSGLLGSAYEDVAANPELSDKADEFTFTNLVMGNQLPILILIAGAIAIMIVLSKRGRVGSPV